MLIIATRVGNCAEVMSGVKQMSVIVLSLKGKEKLFIFLSVAGCLAVQNSFSRLPEMIVPAIAVPPIAFVRRGEQEAGCLYQGDGAGEGAQTD